MADSETKIEPVVEVAKVTSITVRNRDGSFRTMNKDEKGHFIKKARPLPSALEVTRTMRKFLEKTPAGQTESRILRITENIADIADCRELDPKTGLRDPKMAMASVKAFEALWLRAYGKPSLSDDEKDALKHSGVKIVIVEAPTCLPAAEEPKEEKKQPSFAEAEVVQQN
jgi:hypothetical protein